VRGKHSRAHKGTYEPDDLLHCASDADFMVSKNLDHSDLVSGLQSHSTSIVEHDLHNLFRSVDRGMVSL
jgi:hypothetical protein